MTRALLLAAAAAAALALPGVGSAGIASSSTRAVDLAAGRLPVDVAAPARFDLVGVRWRGPGRVQLRTRTIDGSWSVWRDAAPESEDRPDVASPEALPARGWVIGNPWWVGRSDRLQIRAVGAVSRARVTFVTSPEVRVPLRALASAAAPAIVPRSAWGADESIRRGEPTYAAQVRYAVVHHTAGTNDYSRSEAAAIVRGIELFHVRSNGWNDIGYNFLVDRFGTVYEGRYGGIDQNVVGAHAQGFNTGSVGIALLGTYTGTTPPAAAEKALAALLAWRLDLAHADPLATLVVPSGGNERFPAGVPVQLRAVAGHRDTGFTVCPGDALYARLGALATETAATGGPKLYDPVVVEEPGGLVRFRARLSQPLPWTVVVAGPGGGEIARGAGMSADVDWTWDASTAPAGEYRWTIAAGSGSRAVLPATGIVGAAGAVVPLAFLGAAADPETITPNGDGQADAATVTYTLSAAATVTVSVVDEAGAEVALLERARWRRQGEHTLTFDGAALGEGRFAIRLLARSADGTEAEARVPVVITRTPGRASLAPPAFSPNGDGRADLLTMTLSLTREADVLVRVFRDGRWVATPYSGRLAAGRQVVRWDGSKRKGRLRDGEYTAVIDVTDEVGTARIALPFASDTTAPRLRLLSRVPARLSVSEPAIVRAVVNGAVRRFRVHVAGVVAIPSVRTVRTLRVTARDAVGNVSPPLAVR